MITIACGNQYVNGDQVVMAPFRKKGGGPGFYQVRQE